MNRKCNILIVIFCIVSLCVNLFWDEYKFLGCACILAMGIVALIRQKDA